MGVLLFGQVIFLCFTAFAKAMQSHQAVEKSTEETLLKWSFSVTSSIRSFHFFVATKLISSQLPPE